MEVNGTEVGLGFGAFVTSILTYLKLKPKKDISMASLEERIKKIEGRQDRFEDALTKLATSSLIEIRVITEDVKEIKDGMTRISSSISELSVGLARLNGIQEAHGI